MLILVATAEPFNGAHVAANFIRLFIIFVGITLALTCVKIAVGQVMRGEAEKFWGTASFGLLVVTPSISGLLRFGAPLTWQTSATYLTGLLCGIVGLGYRITLSPPWRKFRRERAERSSRYQAAREREDVARASSRRAEDSALAEDRKREDRLLTEHRGRDDDNDRSRARKRQQP